MKIIALLLFRNEEWIIKNYLHSISKIADKIIAISDRSTDNTDQIIKKFNADIYYNKKKIQFGFQEYRLRTILLYLGRRNGGTHFIFLDSDEALDSIFIQNYKNYFTNLKPGQKIKAQWLALWGSTDKYRDDESVWSNNFKDIIFCDDSFSKFENKFLHFGRTPGENTSENTIELSLMEGSVLHYQFSDLKRFNFKQCWYRCIEFLQNNQSINSINSTYEITKNNEINLKKIHNYSLPNKTYIEYIKNPNESWHYNEIIYFFNKFGIGKFEYLDIWYVEELFNEFVKRMGRKPKIKKNSKIKKLFYKVFNKMRNF